jgi:hypothetical protein
LIRLHVPIANTARMLDAMHPRRIATRHPPNQPRRFNAPVLMCPYEDTLCASNKFKPSQLQAPSIDFDHTNGSVAAPVTSRAANLTFPGAL